MSVYTVEEATDVLEHPDFDLIQVPYNAWDPRMLTAGVLDMAHKKGKLCFLRSLFLQGILTMTPETGRSLAPFAVAALVRWQKLASDFQCEPRALAIRFALSLKWPLVIGAERAAQVRSTLQLFSEDPLSKEEARSISKQLKEVVNDYIVDPTLWDASR